MWTLKKRKGGSKEGVYNMFLGTEDEKGALLECEKKSEVEVRGGKSFTGRCGLELVELVTTEKPGDLEGENEKLRGLREQKKRRAGLDTGRIGEKELRSATKCAEA